METNTNIPDIFCFGEVLWDVLPDGARPGGAPLNVAYHLTRLGLNTGVISKVGEDELGRELSSLIDSWGVDSRLLQVDHNYDTSSVIANVNDSNEVSYEILFPVAWDFVKPDKSIAAMLTPSTYLVYGSLASRNDVSRNTLMELLETDAIKVFDINLRPPHINKGLLKVLLSKADIVKFNAAELELMGHLFDESNGDETHRVQFIQREFSIKEVIVTHGAEGAAYYRDGIIYSVPGIPIQVADTIGSGDAFLAAFIANHKLNTAPRQILERAVAMGAFVATKKGGCPGYEITEYLQFRD